MSDQEYRSLKEKNADLVKERWEQLQKMMNEQIMPLIDQSKLLPRDCLEGANNLYNTMTYSMGRLLAPPKPLSPEKAVEQEKVVAERNQRAEERRNKKSDVQECVDSWVKERLDEYDLNPAILDDDDTESFEYERTENCVEHRSGSLNFTISDRAKERIDEAIEGDFKDLLKDHLDESLWDDFEMELDNYESGDMIDSSSELT
jgi:hypothetical protein